jgi:hypothetical protein
VTVSEDFRTSAVAVPTQATPHRATTPSVPTPTDSPEASLASRVGNAVDALRRALEEGTVHHHGRNGVPESWTALGVEVVRAWAAGLDLEGQRRACGACAAAAHA